jgi:hypothetical protein
VMKYLPQVGRHAVAKKLIQPGKPLKAHSPKKVLKVVFDFLQISFDTGEILLVERPLVWVPSPGSSLCRLCHQQVNETLTLILAAWAGNKLTNI